MAYFTPKTFGFLRELAENNNRPWFQENRGRFESQVREPAQRFIVAVGERISEVSHHLRADPRSNGGSMFRIHRDVRFSNDKSPYKTAVGIQFRHRAGKDAYAPGMYLHVEPRSCFFGLGVWHPPSPALRAIRERIVEEPEEWTSVIGGDFASAFDLDGDSLKRAPKGFDPEHPQIEDLRRKDFIGVCNLTQGEVTKDSIVDQVIDFGVAGRPFLRFICDALGVQF